LTNIRASGGQGFAFPVTLRDRHSILAPQPPERGRGCLADLAAGATGRPAWRVECCVKVLYLAAVGALTTAVTACGTQAAGQPAGPPAATATASPARTATTSPQPAGTASWRSPSPPPTLTGPGTLTNSDNGATVRLHAGQQVAVALASTGLFSWHVPAAVGAAVTRVSASGGYPGQQPARAAFLAVRPGNATLTAIDDTACLHAQPACEPAQQEWRVTIIVTGG
jgi:hypothetical protein